MLNSLLWGRKKREFQRAFLGPLHARKAHEDALASKPSPLNGLRVISELTAASSLVDSDNDEPIFLFSAGWRSGSTLLQRLVLSDPDVLLWGEPYDLCAVVPRLMAMLTPFRSGWPPDDYFLSSRELNVDLSSRWVANLYPDLHNFRQAHRSFFDALLKTPAEAAGAKRWGFKEVRLGSDSAFYLRWLYPNARFVFLFRNPYDAYRSYRERGSDWYISWPDQPVFTPAKFGTLWNALTSGMIADATALNAFLVRFEELTSKPEILPALSKYLGVAVNDAPIKNTVGSSRASKEEHLWLPRIEKLQLQRAVNPLAEELGYRMP